MVAVRVKPGASRARVGGCHPGPDGPALIVAVTVPAQAGRATEAARRALAQALGVRPASVSLRRGAASRDKLFAVAAAGDAAAALAGRLAALRDGPKGPA